ncbi:phage/plasmid replication protein, II/X family [Vibrio methylphosphonaticus]|uniref:phage/plasmid replication protein, II/X family n=1 Tax=Vibrio methylphosphonaticus TaxID=2946866 RepID=UPI00202AB79E|nr:phage/plasmid replication protein, II/X family [Vibrio methylphosphonaticus]MCL9777588.1 phage/plasmid replication protein, II/X family [Vibrio methylphosphonaticus]
MIDMLKISVPFKTDFLLNTQQNSAGEFVSYVDIKECSRRGIGLEAKVVHFTGDSALDELEVADLRHPYQSLPTSFTGMAFKIFQGTKLRDACVELKASPAKILQGHNVYGTTQIAVGAFEMLMALFNSYPSFYEMLDVKGSLLDLIDCTFSAKAKTELQAKQVINQLKSISNKQMRASVRNEHETTCYFSRGSRHVDRKVYLKGCEFNRQLNKLRTLNEKGDHSNDRVIDVMSDPKLINFARHLIRFEASAKRRYLDEFDVPKNLFEACRYQIEYEKDGRCLIADIWSRAFSPLMESLKGQKMNVFNDEQVHNRLKMKYGKTTPKGNRSYAKADRVFRLYRSLVSDGYEAVKSSYSTRATFYNNLNLLLEAGFAKAQLQNLQGNGKDNVVPLLQVIAIDFSQQRPSDWVEPKAGDITKLYGLEDSVISLVA